MACLRVGLLAPALLGILSCVVNDERLPQKEMGMLTLRTAMMIAKLSLDDNAATVRYLTSIAGITALMLIVLAAVF